MQVATVSPQSIKRPGQQPRHQLKGRQPTDVALAEVRRLIGPPPAPNGGREGGHRRDLLIEHLHALNDAHHGLPEALLVALAAEMNIPVAEVYEVASFYHHFEVLRNGETGPSLTVRVCDGLSCQLAGASPLLADLQHRLPSLLGRSDVRVQAAPCVGRCDQAPAVQVGQWPLGHATTDSVAALSAQAPEDFEQKWALPLSVQRSVATESVSLEGYVAQGGYALAQQIASGQRDAESVIQALEHAGLRGLGGAGFPAGRKWRIVRGQPAPRLMAVNIDEGEPGTFKDRWYIERDPHRFLEGLLVAAQVVGCTAVYIYLRDEYHHARRLLTQALADLGGNPPCELPLIELRRGAGAYICGEESAMIESIEGKRGEPRLRPPYIAEVGLFGRPTLEHNFETLYWVRDIVQKGGDWFAIARSPRAQRPAQFQRQRAGEKPGVKLAPAGITLRELIDEFCGGMADGHTLYAYLPGGASGWHLARKPGRMCRWTLTPCNPTAASLAARRWWC
jgi:NADH:ubiquinone oxidoreductase subunit E